MLTQMEIHSLVYDYIGVYNGYLGDFSYKTHREFYPLYCELDVDPDEIEGTTRDRFIQIISNQSPRGQAKIVRGILDKYPVDCFKDKERNKKAMLYRRFEQIIERLNNCTNVTVPNLDVTSEVVERALSDVEILIKQNGAISSIDRIHTALHGYLKAVIQDIGDFDTKGKSITDLFKYLKENHVSFQNRGNRRSDIDRIIKALSTILDALNPVRNNASLAHANDNLLDEDEAMLVINTTRTLLDYFNRKLSKENAKICG